jgi:hypothetical protein
MVAKATIFETLVSHRTMGAKYRQIYEEHASGKITTRSELDNLPAILGGRSSKARHHHHAVTSEGEHASDHEKRPSTSLAFSYQYSTRKRQKTDDDDREHPNHPMHRNSFNTHEIAD